jgi:N-acetylglucosamine kinase-like BadF-type ATPase
MPHAALAIDGGQTGIRAQVHSPDRGGRPMTPAGPPREFPGILTHLPLAPQLAEVIGHAARAAGRRLHTVSAGLSGLTDAEATAAELLEAVAPLGVERIHLTHDSVTSYLGALGDARGAVIAAGTGVVTLAVGAHEVARVDGWGYIMGDAGSGYWLGRSVLDAVMRAHDGRGPATALTDVVRGEFPDLEHAYVQLQRDPARISRTASFAAHAAALAATDAVAAALCDAAADELALSVATGLRRVGEDAAQAPAVCFLGGVLRGEHVRARLTARLLEPWPGLEVREPLANGLAGAALLPTLGPGSPLAHQVATATR